MVLFFSNRCSYSKELIQELYKNGLFELFQKVSIDGNPNIPSGITAVPTMIVSGYPRPLVGKECFAWIDGVKKQREQRQAQNNPDSAKGQFLPGSTGAPTGMSGGVHVEDKSSGATNSMAGSDGIPGFQDITPFSDTMGGFSDGYSYLNDERPMEHTFAFVESSAMAPNQMAGHQPMGGGIQTPQEMGQSDKQDEMNRALEKMRAERAQDFSRM